MSCTSLELRLVVRGMGPVPSFKNAKRIMGKNLVTQPKIKRWMTKCIQGFVSQFCSAYPTIVEGMQTEPFPRSWIASFLPLDDSWQWIPEISVKVIQDVKEYEGATITIERIS